MIRYLFIPIACLSILWQPLPESPMPDPSLVYCRFLGYECVIRKDINGNEHGVCIFPDGTECDSWSFYRGTCGQKYSYCSKKGCETTSVTDNKGSYTTQYCACTCSDSSGNKRTIPLMQFMENNGDTLIRSKSGLFGKGN